MPRPNGSQMPHYRLGTVKGQVKASIAALAASAEATRRAKKEAIMGRGASVRAEVTDLEGKATSAASGNTGAPNALPGVSKTPILDRWE